MEILSRSPKHGLVLLLKGIISVSVPNSLLLWVTHESFRKRVSLPVEFREGGNVSIRRSSHALLSDGTGPAPWWTSGWGRATTR